MGGYGPTWDYAEPEPINPCEGKFDGEPCLGVICKGPRWICPKPICCNGNCQSIHLHQCGWRTLSRRNMQRTKMDLPKAYMLQWKL